MNVGAWHQAQCQEERLKMKQKGFIEWINVIWGDLFLLYFLFVLFYIFIILCFIIIFLFFLVGDNYSFRNASKPRITVSKRG